MCAGRDRWPESCGFSITGDGPCYVTAVRRPSAAHTAGITAGDQLLRVDGRNVMDMSAEAVRTLVSHTRRWPPALQVSGRLQRVELEAHRRWGLGLTVRGANPVSVDNVDINGPTYQAGIRPGDLILEVNGQAPAQNGQLGRLLSTQEGRLTLGVVPVEARTHTGQQTELRSSRVRRARDLFSKMNIVLGQDYEKKMAVIGLLKHYAVTRDVDVLAHALSVLLRTPQHRLLIRDIRPFIPWKHREQFDRPFVNEGSTESSTSSMTTNSSHQHNNVSEPSYLPQTITRVHQLAGNVVCTRSVLVQREHGGFGFVLRGHSPVRLESVVPGGPADRAGLCPGDAILRLNGMDVSECSHNHLVRLLKGSGNSPTILVQSTLKVGASRRSDTPSDSSSLYRDAACDWLPEENVHVRNKFRQKVNYLLTPVEKTALQRALTEYYRDRNVAQFVDDLAVVLDTPAKQGLWDFFLPRLPDQHQQYVMRYAPMATMQSSDRSVSSVSSSSVLAPQDNTQAGSFKQQLHLFLTSRERSQLRQALQSYSSKRNITYLLEDLGDVLDTPSKKTLWFFIIPLLAPSHQRTAQKSLGLSEHIINTNGQPVGSRYRWGATVWRPVFGLENLATPISGDVLYQAHTPATGGPEQLAHHRGVLNDGDLTKDTSSSLTRSLSLDSLHSAYSNPSFPQSPPVVHHTRVNGTGRWPSPHDRRETAVQTTPEVHPKLFTHPNDVNVNKSADYKTVVNVFDSPKRMTEIVTVQRAGMYNHGEKTDGQKHKEDRPNLGQKHRNKTAMEPMYADVDTSVKWPQVQRGAPRDVMDTESLTDSYHTKAMDALKALDEVVGEENSGSLDSYFGREENGVESLPQTSRPPPPPPLPPPGPSVHQTEPVGISVKRINWEKLDNAPDNTVWSKIGSVDELDDIVKYLELEQQFAMKKTKIAESFQDRKAEQYIMSAKKAYNISILMGHMKHTVPDIRQALLAMDESVLPPEILKQILAYCPDRNEMEKYDRFTGSLDELSQPDQFVYEMSRVPGFEQRLKALLFKANFAEKVDEVKMSLHCMRKAAIELQQSQRLAKVLEMVLAMGNYMNKGNARVGQAAGFKISFLSKLDMTKTSDGRASFLHVLADAVHQINPEALDLSRQLSSVHVAAKVSDVMIGQELAELRQVLQEISGTMVELSNKNQHGGAGDRFDDVIGHFISVASDEIQSLFSLHASTSEQLHDVIRYFGEDPKVLPSSEFFSVFSEFITKLEKAHHFNMAHKRHYSREQQRILGVGRGAGED